MSTSVVPRGLHLGDAIAFNDRLERGLKIEIKDHRGNPAMFGDPPQPVTITVVGPDSATHRRVVQAMKRERSAALLAAEATGANASADDDDTEGYVIRLLARLIIAWEGVFDIDGFPMPLTVENAEKVLATARYVWPQLGKASDIDAFFTESSPPSLTS